MLTKKDFHRMTWNDKMSHFSMDYELMPLMIHENYLMAMHKETQLQDIQRMATASEFISIGDLTYKHIKETKDY